MATGKDIATANTVNGYAAIIEKAILNPDVDVNKMQQLLDMQERIMTKNAEISFNQAMARLQPKMPVIAKTTKAHNSSYAKYEDIDSELRPLYTEEGFSLSYTSKRDVDVVTYYGTLKHEEGHSITAEIDLPDDSSGSKNALQAKASAMTYAKRYLLTMLLNVVTKDEDDDGLNGGTKMITNEMAVKIDQAINGLKDGKDWKPKFLEYMRVGSIQGIPFKDYGKAMNAINTKKAAA